MNRAVTYLLRRLSLTTIVLALLCGFLISPVAVAQTPNVTVQFESSDFYTSENAKKATITVTLEGDPGGNTVTVDYATSDGTATAGDDYVSTSGTLTFPSGVTSKEFEIVIKRDLKDEEDETIDLELTNPTNADLGDPATATCTIWDNPPEITVSAADSAICAGGIKDSIHQTEITATLTDGVDPFEGETVSFSTTAGTVDPATDDTDSDGKAETTLTSNKTASEGGTAYEATVKAEAGDASDTCDVEFQATSVALEADPDEIFVGETAKLTVTVTFDSTAVKDHDLEWKIINVWDADGNVVTTGKDDYGSLDNTSAKTDEDGKGTADFEAGTKPGKVEIEVADKSVEKVTSGDNPKGKKAVKTFTVTIEKGGANITGVAQTVIVGQKIALTAKIVPANAAVTYLWTIPGTTVKTYTMTLAAGTKTDLDDDDKKKATISFYWIAALAATDVEVKATLKGKSKTAKATFTVLRPTLDEFKSTTTTNTPGVNVGNPGFGGGDELHFGTSASAGITWSAKATAPAGGAGTLGFLQRVNTVRTRRVATTGANEILTSNGFILDRKTTVPPNVFYDSSTTAIAASAQATHGPLDDTPGNPLDGLNKASVNDTFELNLMYRPNAGTPDDNIYVTLGKLDWNWKGAATKGVGGWSMDAAGTFAKDPEGANSTTLPVWTDRTVNQTFTAAMTVTQNTANMAQNAATLIINGTNFNTTAGNNTVTFNLGATGTVTAATATQLTVTFTQAPTSLGNLTVVVTSTSPNNSSGAPVQVATVVEP